MTIWEIFSAIRIKSHYKFLHFRTVDTLPNDLHGDYCPERMKVRINARFGEWNRHWTGYHELLHALSDAYEIHLTEDQVTKLEQAMENVYRYNLGFSLDPPPRKQ